MVVKSLAVPCKRVVRKDSGGVRTRNSEKINSQSLTPTPLKRGGTEETEVGGVLLIILFSPSCSSMLRGFSSFSALGSVSSSIEKGGIGESGSAGLFPSAFYSFLLLFRGACSTFNATPVNGEMEKSESSGFSSID
jgi:hypothetical protein